MRSLLRKTEIIDAQEDGQHGKGKRGDELPPELRRRKRHHAALVVPTGERRTLRGWRSRPPRREPWYHQSSVRGAIGWRCRAATLEACREKELNA